MPTSLFLKGKQRRSHQTHKLPPPGEGSHRMLPRSHQRPPQRGRWAEDRPTHLGEQAGGRRCLQAHPSLCTAAVPRELALTLNSPPAGGWAQEPSASAPPAGWAEEVEPHTRKPLVVLQQTLLTSALWPALCQAGARGAEEGDPGLLEWGGVWRCWFHGAHSGRGRESLLTP